MEKHIQLPLTEELAKTLHAGDTVYLTGTIYTSRDAGHKRMCEALARGEKIPFDPTDATIYYVGPTPAKPGQVIGSAGPTTSGRMDAYAPTMMSVGARGFRSMCCFALVIARSGRNAIRAGCGCWRRTRTPLTVLFPPSPSLTSSIVIAIPIFTPCFAMALARVRAR